MSPFFVWSNRVFRRGGGGGVLCARTASLSLKTKLSPGYATLKILPFVLKTRHAVARLGIRPNLHVYTLIRGSFK